MALLVERLSHCSVLTARASNPLKDLTAFGSLNNYMYLCSEFKTNAIWIYYLLSY